MAPTGQIRHFAKTLQTEHLHIPHDTRRPSESTAWPQPKPPYAFRRPQNPLAVKQNFHRPPLQNTNAETALPGRFGRQQRLPRRFADDLQNLRPSECAKHKKAA
ncbi:hypothetical protein HMPREF9120_01600 [Neisseria sp. oral taxon 020 str. F0370]|nr:hypothetical protein HMPREF9120_01600 [Neisseria sp. oral taxon 020 str. F0370]